MYSEQCGMTKTNTPIVYLRRMYTSEEGTFGALFIGGRPFCVTCEDPWKNNEVGVSCIPKGTYLCTPHNGQKYKGVWILNEVPGRSAILIHAGNTKEDTRGCILVGTSFGVVDKLSAIINSRTALNALRKTLPSRFYLVIEQCF